MTLFQSKFCLYPPIKSQEGCFNNRLTFYAASQWNEKRQLIRKFATRTCKTKLWRHFSQSFVYTLLCVLFGIFLPTYKSNLSFILGKKVQGNLKKNWIFFGFFYIQCEKYFCTEGTAACSIYFIIGDKESISKFPGICRFQARHPSPALTQQQLSMLNVTKKTWFKEILLI